MCKNTDATVWFQTIDFLHSGTPYQLSLSGSCSSGLQCMLLCLWLEPTPLIIIPVITIYWILHKDILGTVFMAKLLIAMLPHHVVGFHNLTWLVWVSLNEYKRTKCRGQCERIQCALDMGHTATPIFLLDRKNKSNCIKSKWIHLLHTHLSGLVWSKQN